MADTSAQKMEREKAIAMALVGIVIVIIIILFLGQQGAQPFPGFVYNAAPGGGSNLNTQPTTYPPTGGGNPQPLAGTTAQPAGYQSITNPIWNYVPGYGQNSPVNLESMPVWPGVVPPEMYDPYGLDPNPAKGCCGCG